MKKTIIAALAALAVLAVNVNAASLSVGDPAPGLKASRWVKGEAVEKIEKNRTYVIEFWATWCPPCRASIPHLTELAHKYKGKVTFVGMDSFERGSEEASNALVNKFVEEMSGKMDYHVAMDTSDKHMSKKWMDAAGQNGIPCAFVVQDGKIAWIGHPMQGLEQKLEEVVAGKAKKG